MIHPGDCIILQFKAEVKLIYRFEIIESVPIHRTTMQHSSIPMISPSMVSASTSNSNISMSNVGVPATNLASALPPSSSENRGFGVIAPSTVEAQAATATATAAAATVTAAADVTTVVAPIPSSAVTVQNVDSTNNERTNVTSSSIPPPPPPPPVAAAAAAATASTTSRKRQKSNETMIDGDMVRMYQDERRQLESEITQLKLTLEGILPLSNIPP